MAEVLPQGLLLGDGSVVSFDDCLWCTEASAAKWIAASGLPTDAGW